MAPNAWLTVNAIALIVLCFAVVSWARAEAGMRRFVVAGVVGVVVGAGMSAALVPADIPTAWVTVLHEGRGVRNLRQLYGLTAHAEGGYRALTQLLSGHELTTLRTIVRLNICLAISGAVLFYFVASAVLRSWWGGLVFLAGYAGNLNTLHAAVSETPAMLWAVYFLLGCVLAALVRDRGWASMRLRWLALCGLALVAALAVLLRKELLLLGAPAVAVGLSGLLGRDALIWQGAVACRRWLRSIMAGRPAIFLLFVAALVTLPYLASPGGHVSYALKAIAPLSLTFLLLPQKLGMFLSFGFIALFVLGMIHTTRRCWSYFFLPIGTILLFKVYDAATQGMLESFRYLTFLTPVVFVISLFGFRELEEWGRRWHWPWWWKRPALVLFGSAMLTAWQPLGPREIFGRRHELPGISTRLPLLARNQQTEVRYLLDLVARYPTCALLAKTTWDEASFDRPVRYRWSILGGGVRHYRETPHAGETPEEAAARLAPEAPCVLFYRGLDCDLQGTDGCRPETDGRTPVEERVLENLPYSDIRSYGAHRAEIRLAVYPVETAGSAR